MEIIHENEYLYKMNDEIEPYLATHRQEGYVPGAENHLHQKDTGIVGKIHVQRYLAEKPKGVIIISHGFTEAAPKYDEMIYYFLKAGYHVYMPEHMGHGQSYRLTSDPSLVHIDTWKRYVRDFLKICHVIKKHTLNYRWFFLLIPWVGQLVQSQLHGNRNCFRRLY